MFFLMRAARHSETEVESAFSERCLRNERYEA
jgi:hypothetical protein